MYVDAVAFARSLGVTITFDKAKRAFTITTPKATPLQDVAGATQLAGGNGKPGQIFGLGQAFG